MELCPWLLLPLLPVFGAFGILKLVHAPEFTFTKAGADSGCVAASPTGFEPSFMTSAYRSFIHFEALMVYVSAGLVHVSLCLLVVLYLGMQIRRLPARTARRSWHLVGLLLVLLIVVAIIARLDATAMQLTYRNTCELLCKADVARHIVPEDCHGGPASRLLWLASLPTLAGLIVAVFAAALSSSVTAPFPGRSEADWRAAFLARIRTLQRSVYATSAVLVTSTVTIMLFLDLPSSLAADKATKDAVSAYTTGMTGFWGTVFTLTLVFIFMPAVIRLAQAARRHEKASEDPSDVRQWLREQISASVPKQVASIAAVVAPLLVGPLGHLMQSLGTVG